jgi:hypothetical protein
VIEPPLSVSVAPGKSQTFIMDLEDYLDLSDVVMAVARICHTIDEADSTGLRHDDVWVVRATFPQIWHVPEMRQPTVVRSCHSCAIDIEVLLVHQGWDNEWEDVIVSCDLAPRFKYPYRVSMELRQTL